MQIEKFDIIVIGAGHAGCEAALAAARLGCKTMLATLSLDNLALMPCNPSIGGSAKGQLVREIDALGGQMGLSADVACLQMRLLNTGKGYAVHSLRGKGDKPFYHHLMKGIIERQENLELKQLMIDKLLVKMVQYKGWKQKLAKFLKHLVLFFVPAHISRGGLSMALSIMKAVLMAYGRQIN